MLENRFFPQARLNYAETALALVEGESEDAIVFWSEGRDKRRWSRSQLQAEVSRFQQALRAEGVEPGDRVAAFLPNVPEAVAAMLAVASIGAVWCSVSPDFGARGALDRLGQISPKIFIACDGYRYAGKRLEIAEKVREIADGLSDLRKTVIVDVLGGSEETAAHVGRGATSWQTFLAGFQARVPTFERLPFDHPLVVLFSSGTTGQPKCIVHRAGGILLQHLKEHGLHADLKPGDRLFYFTTLGWMMWNWLASGLARGATLLLYDGSPFHPRKDVLFDYARDERATHFGTSAKYLDTARKFALEPRRTHDLSPLRCVLSTGSPLTGEGFEYVYGSVKADVHLASISGGTDIASCFALGDPTRAVMAGEIQGPGLGMAIAVLDDDARPVAVGEKGDLVCMQSFPAMPLGFWNDPGGTRYHAAYFERFPGIWAQGDFAEPRQGGGFVLHGRSDAVLNPGGVRIGTAEIYAPVEAMSEILEAVAVGQEHDGDVRVILFVRLREELDLDEELCRAIRITIRDNASPRHVPALILAVNDIPRTRSGKIVELAVRDVIHGRSPRNVEALANPAALELFRDRPELA